MSALPKIHPSAAVRAAFERGDPWSEERPDVAACLIYWQDLHDGKQLPRWADFDWFRLPSKVYPYLGVVDVTPEPLDFVYRYWGTGHSDAHCADYTGESVAAVTPQEVGYSLFEQYRLTFEAAEACLFDHEIRCNGSVELHEKSVRMPFTDGGDAITKILSFSDIRGSQELARAFFKMYG